MSDPTLKRTSVTIKHTSSDGYRSEVNYCQIGRRGIRFPPEGPLLEAIEELARLTAMYGFEDRALAAFNGARQRVIDWRASRPVHGANVSQPIAAQDEASGSDVPKDSSAVSTEDHQP